MEAPYLGEQPGPAATRPHGTPFLERILAPFPDAAREIADSKGRLVRRERADGLRLRAIPRARVSSLAERPVEAVSPGKQPPVRPARRPLPLLLLRQRILPALPALLGAAVQPRRVGAPVLPGDSQYRPGRIGAALEAGRVGLAFGIDPPVVGLCVGDQPRHESQAPSLPVLEKRPDGLGVVQEL